MHIANKSNADPVTGYSCRYFDQSSAKQKARYVLYSIFVLGKSCCLTLLVELKNIGP